MHRAAKLESDLANQRWISTGIRRLYLPPPQGGFAGTKDSAGVSAQSNKRLRPLNVSRVKCGADLVAATQCILMRQIYIGYGIK